MSRGWTGLTLEQHFWKRFYWNPPDGIPVVKWVRGRESSSFHGSEFYCRHLTCHTSSQEIDYYQLQHRASLKRQTLELQWNPEGFRMSLGCFLKSSRLKHIPWAFQRLCWIRSPELCWMWHWQTQTAAMHSNNCHSMSNEACICIRITRENTKRDAFLGMCILE